MENIENMENMAFSYDHGCFGCGERNPIGLKLKFHQEEEVMKSSFVPQQEHQGYPGLMHGGIISTVLDEIMSKSINARGFIAVTARLEVRFLQGVPIGKPLRIEGWITAQKGRLIDTQGRILLEDGQVAAEARARFMIKGGNG